MADEKADWREQYRQALFEADPQRVLTRIEEAHDAIRYRICELWESDETDIRERSELDSAAYFLGLLRTIAANKEKSRSSPYSSVDSRKRDSPGN